MVYVGIGSLSIQVPNYLQPKSVRDRTSGVILSTILTCIVIMINAVIVEVTWLDLLPHIVYLERITSSAL